MNLLPMSPAHTPFTKGGHSLYVSPADKSASTFAKAARHERRDLSSSTCLVDRSRRMWGSKEILLLFLLLFDICVLGIIMRQRNLLTLF